MQKSIRIDWGPAKEPKVLAANKIVCQFEGDVFVATFGILTPPILLGTEEEIRDQVEAIESVPVGPVARIAMTEQMLERVINTLSENLANYRSRQATEGE